MLLRAFRMAVQATIAADLTRAMKARDAIRVSVLRLMKTALGNAAIAARAGGAELTEDAAIAVLRTEAKRLRESIEEFRKGSREDLASATDAELAIVTAYLPAQMTDEAIRVVVRAKRSELGDGANMGKIMGAIMADLAGKADGGVVRRIVAEETKQ